MSIDKQRIAERLESTRSYLTDALLPFWIERSPDESAGGFLTYFDRNGEPTGETTKTLLMQLRMLYTMASAHRAGYGGGRCAELARMGADFVLDHYWDDANDGWIWIGDRDGRPMVRDKIGYGQCFALYAFSEYFLATGDERGRDAAGRTYSAIALHMADTRHGGYLELLTEDWRPAPPGPGGGDRKSMDVHMHMMEALTTFCEMTRAPSHRRRLAEAIDLLITRMLHPAHGTGYIQFTVDFEPLPAILFGTSWGRDAPPVDGVARPLDTTSYGHNVEFAWLLLHAADVLGRPREQYAEVLRRILDHTVAHGVDREFGGLFVEGLHDGPATVTEKQFWQQAEALIGLLDGCLLLARRADAYFEAFENIYRFVFEKFVNLAGGGEWFERLDRQGRPIDDALGHAFKISYHTVRSMIQTVERLERLLNA